MMISKSFMILQNFKKGQLCSRTFFLYSFLNLFDQIFFFFTYTDPSLQTSVVLGKIYVSAVGDLLYKKGQSHEKK